MEIPSFLEPSLATLITVSATPFLFFFYRGRFWYRPDIIKTWDFLLSLFAILIIVYVVSCIPAFRQSLMYTSTKELYLLHLFPPFLIFLLLSNPQNKIKNSIKTSNSNKKQDGASPPPFEIPVPQNKEVEQIGWDNLIIDQSLKDELLSVVELLKDPKTTKKYGIEVPKGILLNGPPGTGKTTIAKVMATTAGLSFFVLKADEIVSKWVGESEKNLSRFFDAATKKAPALIFIDEIDSLAKSRGGQQEWADNLLNHLLQLIDGVVKRDGLYIIAATNRADLVDSALKRGGRLNRVIEIPLPGIEARSKLFELYLSKLALASPVDFEVLAKVTEGKSAADIKAMCNQAGLNSFRRESSEGKREYKVTHDDIKGALVTYLG